RHRDRGRHVRQRRAARGCGGGAARRGGDRHMSAVHDFIARFGRAPAVVAEAPGRVNVIGEHTDYNGGLVLPIAIPLVTTVALTPRSDQRVHVTSDGVSGVAGAAAEYRLEHERAASRWTDYVQGCTAMLLEAGHPIRGFD